MRTLLTLILVSAFYVAIAQPGSLDPSFGNGGKAIIDINNTDDYGSSIILQDDGKIIIAGTAENQINGYRDFAIIRLEAFGYPDNSFGLNGKVVTDFGFSYEECNAIALQDDGKLIAVGCLYNGSNSDIALSRYNTNGSIDNTFGTNGKVIINFGGSYEAGYAISILSNSKILIAGSKGYNFFLCRLNTNGSLDGTFGSGGYVITVVGPLGGYANSICVQNDGKIILAGFSEKQFPKASEQTDFAIVRYNSNGSLDNTFGTSGIVITDVGGIRDRALSVILQNDGKIIAAGQCNSYDFATVRYNSNGTLDNTFGINGKVITDFAGDADICEKVLLQQNGKIVGAGYVYQNSNYSFALVRYNANGSIDNTFGANGKVITDFGSNNEDKAFGLIIQPDGKIIAAGYALGLSSYDYAISRYLGDMVIISGPSNISTCVNSTCFFSVTATGNSLSYQWQYYNGTNWDNITNSSIYQGTTTNHLQISNTPASLNNYQYRCIVTDGVTINTTNAAVLTVLSFTADAGPDSEICYAQSVQLNASGGISYIWNPSIGLNITNINNPIATPAITTTYTVQVTDQNGCTQTDSVTITVQNPYSNEQICLVTVDTVVWKNKVMWEKTANVGTLGFNVYKEVASNVYSGIGFVPYNDPSFLIDYASVPESYGNKYKIAVVDTCGNESLKSYYHKTMNLTIAAFGSTMGLSWTAYVDESGVYVPPLYYIYRGTSPTNMQILDSIPGSQTSYNDNNVFTVYYYIIGVKKDPPCDIYGSGESFSNKKDNSTLVGIVQHNGNNTEAFIIYPNPFKESTTIKFYNPDKKTFLMTLTDSKGRVVIKVKNVTSTEIIIERKDLKIGVYFMELKGESRTYRGKIMIE